MTSAATGHGGRRIERCGVIRGSPLAEAAEAVFFFLLGCLWVVRIVGWLIQVFCAAVAALDVRRRSLAFLLLELGISLPGVELPRG